MKVFTNSATGRKGRWKRFTASLALCLGLAALFPGPADTACVTRGCHAEMAAADVHPDDADCGDCHVRKGDGHPTAGVKTIDTDDGEICVNCHEGQAEGKFAHPPAKDGGCAACHDPHGRAADALLAGRETDICAACHPGVVKAGETPHGPIGEGNCSKCHDPHGADYKKLLRLEYPVQDFVAYTDKEYELCFSCHPRDLLRFPDTSFATGFRDGDRNLHYLHVNKANRGRACRLCHRTHGAGRPKLMAETIPFGNWALPLNFEINAYGGSCRPGCHKAQAYDRRIKNGLQFTVDFTETE